MSEVKVGYDANKHLPKNATAVGTRAMVSADDAVAFGHGAVANGKRSVAIGHGAVAANDDDVVITVHCWHQFMREMVLFIVAQVKKDESTLEECVAKIPELKALAEMDESDIH